LRVCENRTSTRTGSRGRLNQKKTRAGENACPSCGFGNYLYLGLPPDAPEEEEEDDDPEEDDPPE
jgi:hypothetical protein